MVLLKNSIIDCNISFLLSFYAIVDYIINQILLKLKDRVNKFKDNYEIDTKTENNHRGSGALLDCACYRCAYTDTAISLQGTGVGQMASFSGVSEPGFSAVVFRQTRQQNKLAKPAGMADFSFGCGLRGDRRIASAVRGKDEGFMGFFGQRGWGVGGIDYVHVSGVLAGVAGGIGYYNLRADEPRKGQSI
jgi:hypothetical protein